MANEKNPMAWALLPLKRYAQFSGRSARAEYWWFMLFYMVAGFAIDAVDMAIGSEMGVLGLTYTFALLIPSISVTVRRLHDISLSGWWIVAVIAPAAVFGFQSSFAALEENFNGVAPTGSSLLAISAFVIFCLVLTICMALPGNKGDNRYGADPYGGSGEVAIA